MYSSDLLNNLFAQLHGTKGLLLKVKRVYATLQGEERNLDAFHGPS